MLKKERLREPIASLANPAYITEKAAAGWKLVAIEWEREVPAENEASTSASPNDWTEEIPYGLQVSEDGGRLIENPSEMQTVILALDMIVEDCPLSEVAAEMNRRGYRTRTAQSWTPTALFTLLPRMIQLGPRLFSTEQWMTRRQRLQRVV